MIGIPTMTYEEWLQKKATKKRVDEYIEKMRQRQFAENQPDFAEPPYDTEQRQGAAHDR